MDVEEPRRVSHPEEPAARDVISAESFVGRLLNARVSLSANMLCKSGSVGLGGSLSLSYQHSVLN